MDFGIYYTCFTEVDAVENSLDVLYRIYPECPVYLVSDGGADYSFLEKKFPHLKTVLGSDSRSFIPRIKKEDYMTPEVQEQIIGSIHTFFDRNMKAIEHCNKPHMLIMEPDALVRGKLTCPTTAKLLGSRVNQGLNSELKEVLSKIPGAIIVDHWGATPAIYEVEAFKKVNAFIHSNPNIIKEISMADERFSNYDVTFAVLFGACGYPEVANPELTECLRNPNWRNTSHPLLHQYREYYPTDDGYEGRHKKARKDFQDVKVSFKL